jgi:DMSO/TMAO reductase YedYZ heme-binding membrane subunit
MALVSNKYAGQWLGAERWRTILRIGYIAYVLGAMHSGFWSYEDWQMWFGDVSLPPISLVITVFVGLVVLLRVVLWWVLNKKNKKS